jgi:hypothetical protein
MRGILLFDTPEQDKATIDTAIEKLGIGVQPPVAINASGQVAFTLPAAASFPIGGTTFTFGPGVYRATPTLFNTPKALTKIADDSGPYCRFGVVDINDSGTVVFEAALDTGSHCTGSTAGYDGIFAGPDPDADQVVVSGDSRLGAHQNFDTIHLGEINNAGQVAFLTELSASAVNPLAVWRWAPM